MKITDDMLSAQAAEARELWLQALHAGCAARAPFLPKIPA